VLAQKQPRYLCERHSRYWCILVMEGDDMTKFGPKAQQKVEETVKEMKEGKLKSGKSGKKVTSRKQAVAIGLSQARKEGAKVPKNKS